VTDQNAEPLGEVLARALDARGVWQEPAAAKPAAKAPSLFELAKNASAASYIAARRRDADLASRR
jgi:hypothetical protein